MQQTEAWLALTHVKNLGPATLKKLFNQFDSPIAVLNASGSALQALGINKTVIDGLQNPDEGSLASAMQALAALGSREDPSPFPR